MEETFNKQFKTICKDYPELYGADKSRQNKKFQLRKRMEDENDKSDMRHYFETMIIGPGKDQHVQAIIQARESQKHGVSQPKYMRFEIKTSE
eukprot:SAG31_NODE_10250_length_1164_cov_2.229108_2_plen_92_part_00